MSLSLTGSIKYLICCHGATDWACTFLLMQKQCLQNSHLLTQDTWGVIVKQWTLKTFNMEVQTNSDAVKHNTSACRDTQSALCFAKGISRLISQEEQGLSVWRWWIGTDTVNTVIVAKSRTEEWMGTQWVCAPRCVSKYFSEEAGCTTLRNRTNHKWQKD